MDVRMPRAAFSLALTVFFCRGAAAAGITTYFESSANQKPRGNAGLSVDADRIRLKADVSLRSNDRTQVVPQVTSAVSITDRVDLETHVNLADWNGRTEQLDRTFDTRLHFRSPAPFLKELEGRVWRSPDGRSGRILKLGFYQKLRQTPLLQPLAIRGHATVEATTGAVPLAAHDRGHAPASAASRRIGIETEVVGLMSGLRGRQTVRVKLERVDGARPQSASSLAYDHAWSLGAATRVGVNLQMLRASYLPTDDFAPTLGVTWQSDF
jgi:hypothetical protein